jgi:hypothetical protein
MGEVLEDGRPVMQGNKYRKAASLNTKTLKEDELDEWLYNNVG